MTQPPLTARLRDFIDTHRGIDNLGYTGLMFQAAEALERQEAELANLRARLDRAVKAAEEHFGEDAIRYKLSLFQNGRARNVFPSHMDGKWFAFQRADNDAHVGLALRCAELVAACENARDILSTDRQAWVDCQQLRDNRTDDPIAHGLVAVEDGVWLDSDDAEALRDYDRAIALIDAAIAKNQCAA